MGAPWKPIEWTPEEYAYMRGLKLGPHPCVNCGRAITEGQFPLHLEGMYRGKNRCCPGDTDRPYGLEATAP